jgi:cell division protein FtsQ
VPTLGAAARTGREVVATLDYALGRLARPFAGLVPRRLRRVAEKIERQRTKPIGQIAAAGFLGATVLYGLAVGGQIGRLGDSLLVAVGFGVENVRLTGNQETSELAVVEALDLGTLSLIAFDVEEARTRLERLPWVAEATVRKFYPNTVTIDVQERKPFALWQSEGEIFVIDGEGNKIVALDDRRFSEMPFVVGAGANEKAGAFLTEVLAQPVIAQRMRAAVYVAERRWDVHLENGVTVKLPEKAVGPALAQLVKIDAESQLLSRDVVVIDLRIQDRITVRLPEGRSLDEINGDPSKKDQKVARART